MCPVCGKLRNVDVTNLRYFASALSVAARHNWRSLDQGADHHPRAECDRVHAPGNHTTRKYKRPRSRGLFLWAVLGSNQ